MVSPDQYIATLNISTGFRTRPGVCLVFDALSDSHQAAASPCGPLRMTLKDSPSVPQALKVSIYMEQAFLNYMSWWSPPAWQSEGCRRLQ